MMKKLLNLIAISFLFVSLNSNADAQWLKKLGEKAEEAAKRTTERKVEQKTEKAVGEAIDNATDPNSKKSSDNNSNNNQQSPNNSENNAADNANENNPKIATAPQGTKAAEMTYAKSDFVPGDEIIFDDNLANEKMGEFPSMWDLLKGSAEVANFGGIKCIFMETPSTDITPLMKNMKEYLPDVFTLELDYWVNNWDKDKMNHEYQLHFYNANGKRVMHLDIEKYRILWYYKTPNDIDGNDRSGNLDRTDKKDSWHHLSISFNKRAFKVYIDGERIINIPNMAAPVRFNIDRSAWNDHRPAIANIRIAKGAVPLYDRMMSDGKIISYGITFDVGKSTIKPESMGEINRIVTLMNENPELKFSVEGHTDNTGTAANNQKLSDERSAAVVSKLVEMGVAKDRLKSAGKGQTTPIADNGTDEGRAKNRRVEFVKM